MGLRIHVLSDYLQEAYIEVLPELRKSTKVLQLCFWAEDWPKKCQFIKAIDLRRYTSILYNLYIYLIYIIYIYCMSL